MANVSACPPTDKMRQLAVGGLPAKDMENLVEHLEACSECLDKIRTISPTDTLVEALGRAKSMTPRPEGAIVSRLIDCLTNMNRSEVMEFSCPACGKGLKCKSELAGRKVICPKCGKAAPVPAINSAPLSSVDRTLPPREREPQLSVGARVGQSSATRGDVDSAAKEEAWDFLAPAERPDEMGRLGPYRILKVLGAGGMGVVFCAEDPRLERIVAIKAMLPALAASASAKKRFLREAKTAASMKHDHIVTIYQVDEDRGAPYLAMEFLHGEALDDRLKREDKLPVADVLRIGREIAEGLAAAHDNGLIHRDIKPANIWLETRSHGTGVRSQGAGDRTAQRVKILDFGLARATDDQTGLTQTGAIIGTPAFMAPEQAQSGVIDGRCDLFSLGCVLYRMCTGDMPFNGQDTISILMAIATSDPPPPHVLNPEVPPALSEFIMKLLAKDAGERPATAHDVAVTLHEMETALKPEDKTQVVNISVARPESSKGMTAPLSTSSRSSKTQGVPHSKKKRGMLLTAGIAAAIALVAAGVVFFWQSANGLVRIEIDDDEVEVVLTKTGATIKKADKSHDFTLTAGTDHRIKVKRGDGFEFETKDFVVRKGDKITVKVDVVDGKVIASAAGTVIGSKALPPGVATPFANAVSPFDRLTREKNVAPEELKFFGDGDPAKSPKELVAVFGDSRLIHPGLKDLAFHPDGKTITSSGDGLIRDWDATTGRLVRIQRRATGGNNFIAYRPGGAELAIAIYVGVVFRDVSTAKEWQATKGGFGAVSCLTFSKDGARLAYAAPTKEPKVSEVRIWDATAIGKELQSIKVKAPSISRLAFSPDGARLAGISSSSPGLVFVWEAATGKEVRSWQAYPQQIRGLVFTNDSKQLVTGSPNSSGGLKFWDAETGVESRSLHKDRLIQSLALSPDGKYLAFGHNLGLVILETVSGNTLWEKTKDTGGIIYHVAFSADGQRLATENGNGTLAIWDVVTGKEVTARPGHAGPTNSVAVSPDGRTMASASAAGDVWLWNVAKGTGSKIMALEHVGAEGIAFRPDGRQLAVAQGRYWFRFWDITAGKELSRPEPGTSGMGSSGRVSYSPDGTRLLHISSGVFRTAVWDVAMRTRVLELPFDKGQTYAAIYSPDGRFIARAQADAVRLYDAITGNEVRVLDDRKRGDCKLAFSPDSRRLLVSEPKPSSVWDVAEGRMPYGVKTPPTHNSAFTWPVAYAPDGQTIAGTARHTEFTSMVVWDAATGEVRRVIRLPAGFHPKQLVYAPDARHLVAANPNGTIAVYRIAEPPASASVPDTSFFNGKDLTGFKDNAGAWKVVDGALVGHFAKGVRMDKSDLSTAADHSDFELSFCIKYTSPLDGKRGFGPGFNFRCAASQRGWSLAFQATQVVPHAALRGKAAPIRSDEFNDILVRCVRNTAKVVVNGETVVDGECKLSPAGPLVWGPSSRETTIVKDIRFVDLSKKP